MKLKNVILGVLGILGLLKIIEMLNIEYEEEVTEVNFHLDSENEVEFDADYDPEYTDDEDILDELEAMDVVTAEKVVHQLAEELEEEAVVEPMMEEVGVTSSLNKRQEQILGLFDKHSKVDTTLLMEKISSTTVRTLRRDLSKIEELGLIKKVGKTKGSYYIKKA